MTNVKPSQIAKINIGCCAVTIVALILALNGCKESDIAKNEAIISAGVRSAAHVGVWKGLEALGKKNPGAARQTADSLRMEIDSRLLPWLLDDQRPLLSGAVRDELTALRSSRLDPLVSEAIILAATVLDAYLPVPSSNRVLSDVQRRILARFCEGISAGCTTYLAGAKPEVTTMSESDLAKKGAARKAKRSWVNSDER